MDLPPALLRMLASSCENDQLKNWSVYEERDGVYTFKIRFIPSKVNHIGSADSEVQSPVKSVHNIAFKQKNEKQLLRDRNRFQDWSEKRVTRSVAKQQANSQVVTGVNGATQPADHQMPSRINPESPIERFRGHASMSSSTPNPDVNFSRETVRKDYSISNPYVPSASDDECELIDNNFCNTGDCDPGCCFAGAKADGNHTMYKCLKCASIPSLGLLYICEPCMEGGGHAPHRKYLELCPSNM